jgi:hypothetical protein
MGTTQSHRFGGVSWLPGWLGTQGIEALLWDSEMQAIGLMPQQAQASGSVLNSRFVPSPFMPNPEWNSVNGKGTTLLPASQAPNPVNGLSDAVLPPEQERYSVSVRNTARGDVLPAAPGNIQVTCNNMLPVQLQAGGQYWTPQAVTPAPVSFAPGEFGATPFLNSGALGDPAFAPTYDKFNLLPPVQAGGWCRPPPTPFSQTSPLARYIFWIPFLILLGALMVLFLSRGVRMPRV